MDSEIYSKYEIIDSHAHIFPEKIAENATVNIGAFYDLHMESCGISKKLIESGSKIGVAKYLVCSTATTPHQISSINAFIANECRQNNCFFGLGTTHPDSENIEADIQQIKSLGLHGVKLHPDFQKFDADSREAFRIYEMIEGEMPLLIHCGDNRYDYSAPQRIANIHKNFPKLKLHSAHLGGYQRWEEAEEFLAGLENVVFDISSSMAFMPAERVVNMIRKYGVEKCFFGSDFPMWSHEEELERFLNLGFTVQENRMILSENFRRFYGI
ncbi:MAG: amidohydrolase family protein [Ruminococcus sp.]|nr:amidohydrolase family protein [Ruminococcus sp.]